MLKITSLLRKNLFLIRNFQGERGQVLLEAIVALSILVLILAAISIVVIVSVNNSTFVKNQSEANKYAQEGMERMRYIRDSDRSEFNSYVTTAQPYCLRENDTELLDPFEAGCAGASVNIQGKYIRWVRIEQDSPECDPDNNIVTENQTRVIVEVHWASPKCPTGPTVNDRYCHKVEVTSCFDATQVSI